MLREADLIGDGTETEAYMRVAHERYLLLRTHEWDDDVVERCAKTSRIRARTTTRWCAGRGASSSSSRLPGKAPNSPGLGTSPRLDAAARGSGLLLRRLLPHYIPLGIAVTLAATGRGCRDPVAHHQVAPSSGSKS